MIIYLKYDSLCNISKLIIKFQKEKSFNPLKKIFLLRPRAFNKRAISKPSN